MAMALSSPPGPTVRLSSSTFSLPYQVRLHQLQHPIRSTSALPIVSNFRSLLRSSAVSTSRLKICCAMPSTSDPKSGVAVCKPKLFEALVSDAANALAYAIEDGKTKVEIDFPPLPSNLSSYKGSSDEFIDANIQLVLAVVRKLQEKRQLRVSIVFPDKPEKRRAAQILATALDSVDGISIGSPDDAPGTAVSSFFRSIRNTLDLDFDDENEGRWESNQPADLYVFINCSGCELSLIEKYVEKFATSTSLLFNLELYTLWHVPTFNTTWVGRPFLSIPTNTVTAAPFRFTNPLLPESSMTLNPWKFHLPSTSSTKLPFSFTTKPRIPTHLCFFNSNTNTNKKSKHQYTTPIPASEIPARDRVLDFGKYKGRMLGTLPSTYLRWVSKNLRARDFEEWAIMADQVLQDPYYKDRLEWECAEKVLNGDILTSFSHSLPSSPSSPSFALEEISDRFGWDNEDKVAWSKVNFELLGTSKGGRIPRISQEEGRRRLKREEEVGGGSVKGEEMGKEERRAGVKGRRNERRDRVRLKKNGGGGMDVRSKRTYDGLEEDREERLEVRLLHRRDEDDGDVFNRFPGREGLLKKVLSSKQRRRGTI